MNEDNNTNEQPRIRGNAARLTSLMKRADNLAEQGMYDEAIENIKEAMAICPLEPRCSVQLANIYRAQNRIGPAIEAMHRAVELDPMNAEAFIDRAASYHALGDHEKGLAVAKTLLYVLLPRIP